jgi:hypothetical protein
MIGQIDRENMRGFVLTGNRRFLDVCLSVCQSVRFTDTHSCGVSMCMYPANDSNQTLPECNGKAIDTSYQLVKNNAEKIRRACIRIYMYTYIVVS